VGETLAALRGHVSGPVISEQEFDLDESDPLFWMEWEDQQDDPVINAFCPTGPGGGVDPSCSPGGVGAAAVSGQVLPPVGGSFEKVYKGQTFKVEVVHGGFKIGDKTYGSLTSAAKAVKGSDTAVNGWAFFGVSKPGTILTTPVAPPALPVAPLSTPHPVYFPPDYVPPVEGMKYIKDLPGTTGPKLMEDEAGNRWVVKSSPAKQLQLANEVDADNAYRALGVKVPKSGIAPAAGTTGIAKVSEYHEGVQTLAEYESSHSPADIAKMHEQIGKHFVADSLLANWDVAGLTKDNILITKDGTALRADNGGALLYRAQGAAKGHKFGSEVGELSTLRNSSLNPSAASVFGHIGDKEIKEQIKEILPKKMDVLKAIKNPETRAIVDKRFDSLQNWLKEKEGTGIPKPAPAPTYTPTQSQTYPQASTEHQLHSANGLVKHLFQNKGTVQFTHMQLAKISALNPQGIKNGVIKVPMFSGDKGANAKKIEDLGKVLPAGTVIKKSSITPGKLAAKGISVPKYSKVHHESELDFGAAGVEVGKPSATVKPMTQAEIAAGTTDGATHHLTSSSMTAEQEKQHEKWAASLSSSERSAIAHWKGGSQSSMRNQVTTGTQSESTKNFLSAVYKSPPYAGTVYRGIHGAYSDELIKKLEDQGVGGTYVDTAPHGTSLSPSTSYGFSYGKLLLRIKTKGVHPIISSDGFKSEKELIGRHGTVYIVKGIHKNANIHNQGKVRLFVDLEES
jgi:hypothetical protein